MKKALFNWSGGKDSALCLYKLLNSGEYEVSHLVTTVNKEKGRVSMHGVREQLLELQAERLGLPLHKVWLPDQVSMADYDRLMSDTLEKFKREGIRYSVFGDIFLEDLRSYREKRLSEAGFEALFPLWKQPTRRLAFEFIELGFKAVIVCIDESKLDQSFAGREYDHRFLEDLPDSVDPCGEYGEFHSFVYDGPIFREPVPFKKGEVVYRTYTPTTDKQDDHQVCSKDSSAIPSSAFWFCDLILC